MRLVALALIVLIVAPVYSLGQPVSSSTTSTPIDSANPWAGWTFRDQSYYDSFVAEPRAARTQILLGISRDFPFQVNTGPRHAWDITLGKDQPLVGWRTQTVRPGEFFRRGRAGWGIWFPVSFHMIEDFSDDSNPIINTDMRFGATIKAQVGLSARADKALSFRITPFAHESTHIGDEFALTAIQDASFRRVNVSYEYFEYAVAYDTLTYRVGGGIRQVYGLDGYYSREAFGPGGLTTVALSRRNFDFWLAYERRFEKKDARDWFLSLHAEPLKPVYDYGPLHDTPVATQFSITVSIGRAARRRAAEDMLRVWDVRLYYGVNPHGQFRTEDNYWFVGTGFYFGR